VGWAPDRGQPLHSSRGLREGLRRRVEDWRRDTSNAEARAMGSSPHSGRRNLRRRDGSGIAHRGLEPLPKEPASRGGSSAGLLWNSRASRVGQQFSEDWPHLAWVAIATIAIILAMYPFFYVVAVLWGFL
jgi:hypothetical protein